MDAVDRVRALLGEVGRDLEQLRLASDGLALIDVDGMWFVTYGGGYEGGGVDVELGREELLVQLADDLQTQVSNYGGDPVWPVCPVHGFGLHPELDEDRGVWRCRPFAHSVGYIGQLCS